MFCNQCEQTAKGIGCSVIGVCGKNEEVADLQDLLVYALQVLPPYAQEGRRLGIVDDAIDHFTYEAIFSTLTNVDFDPERSSYPAQAHGRTARGHEGQGCGCRRQYRFQRAPGHLHRHRLRDRVGGTGQGAESDRNLDADENVRSLKQTVLYGLKGIAAYADHAAILGKTDPAVAAFCYEALIMLLEKGMSVEQGVPFVLKTGEINLKVMELLDAANTSTYGHPVPTPVPLGHRKNKCVLITGHDLRDLEMLLKQTEGKGIDIYTHGELPVLPRLPGAGRSTRTSTAITARPGRTSRRSSPTFPGPILFTTNCIQKPLDSYKDRVFTNGPPGWPGVKHISDKDYSAVVDMALAMDGFTDDEDKGQVLVGFGRNAVLGVADKVIEACTPRPSGLLFLVGGCDGAKPGRNYYTKFVEQVPKDCVVLTLACGKFRFFDMQLGDIGGIPRLLDVGQCNDAYSAIQIAVAAGFAKAFDCEVNELPLSMILSGTSRRPWPSCSPCSTWASRTSASSTLPAFVSPAVLQFLVDTFAIKPVSETPSRKTSRPSSAEKPRRGG